jgi:hypothetical protein
MFTALPKNLISLKSVLNKITDEIGLIFCSEYGDFDLGNFTKAETYFKIEDGELYRNPKGFLYNFKLSDDKNNIITRLRVISEDINFNINNFSFCKTSKKNKEFELTGLTLVINNNTITFNEEKTFEDIINLIDIENVGSYIEDDYLVIYSTKLTQSKVDYKNLTLGGTSLTQLGLTSGKFNNSSCYFIINGNKYDVKDSEDGINEYVKYFWVSRR